MINLFLIIKRINPVRVFLNVPFAVFLLLALLVSIPGETLAADQPPPNEGDFVIIGQLLDEQGQAVKDAVVTASTLDGEYALAETESLEDGTWRIFLVEVPPEELQISINHPRFVPVTLTFKMHELEDLDNVGLYQVGELELERSFNAGFWAATLIFIGVLLLIALEKLHSTTAALAGMSAVFLISYVGSLFDPGFFIFTFDRGLSYINWEVIFLVMGMMIIVAIIEATGIFQWMAFQAYRLSRGRNWLLVLILIAITAFASALLDNFTTMLLMTPISLQIGLALGIHPIALIIPQILASNIGGISTLVGTPTNILIGAYANITFTDFLVNQTIGVIFALIAMSAFILFHYRKDFFKKSADISPALYQRLEENARMEDPQNLWKAGTVFLLVIIGFILGEQVHLSPAVPAIIGATILLIWLKPDVHQMIIAVDWTTLVFFMALFVVVGAIQEVGLLGLAASSMANLIGDNLPLGIFMIVFGVGTLSTIIANIPLAAAMLPIVDFLTVLIPGADSKVLFYALSMGAAMGGNGTLIGGEANLVTAGITNQTNTPITFREFLKVGLPVTYISLAIGFLWLLVRF
ncbi:MAG: SLC13 family permease [Anaerolineales bacterium]|jgi:Na+/H+ antiporter NhaD/arsenite permease-like protein